MHHLLHHTHRCEAKGLLWLAAAALLFSPLIYANDYAEVPVASVDRVLIVKSERKLHLLNKGKSLREYDVVLGENPRGHKLREGDKRTPEGWYMLDWRNENSQFHKSIHVSYPSTKDRWRAAQYGVDPGGEIMIHGYPRGAISNALKTYDWTDGCIAVANSDMEEIWRLVKDGTPIEILP